MTHNKNVITNFKPPLLLQEIPIYGIEIFDHITINIEIFP